MLFRDLRKQSFRTLLATLSNNGLIKRQYISCSFCYLCFLIILYIFLTSPSETNAQQIHHENYFLYWYPSERTQDWKDRNAQGVFAGEWGFQVIMAEARDHYYKHASLNLAMVNYQKAKGDYVTVWNQEANDVHKRHTARKLRDHADSNITSPDRLYKILEDLTPLSWAFAAASVAPSGAGYYYIAKFLIPLSYSDIYADYGNFEDALKSVFSIWYNQHFSKRSNNTDLEQYYGENIADGLPSVSIRSVNKYTQITLEDDSILNVNLHPIEQKALLLKIAAYYKEWGDLLYRRRDLDGSKTKFMQILRIYSKVWSNTVYNSSGSPQTYNPRVVRLVLHADRQLRKINAGLNYLGYPRDYIPTWNYDYLRGAARYFIDQARSLERDALNFLRNAEEETDKNLVLSQGVELAEKSIELEQLKVDLSNKSKDIADANYSLAYERWQNKGKEIAEFEKNHPLATTRDADNWQGFIARKTDWLEGGALNIPWADSYFRETGGYLGSVMGFSTSGPIQRREKEELYHSMQREEYEHELASNIASLEAKRAGFEVAIAKKGKEIAQLELEHANERLRFAKQKILNEEFWYKMSRDVRRISRQYIEYGITLAWLTQQSYNFEELANADLIKFDYLSSWDWLAADQLQADLDTIEYRRIVNKKNKEIPVTYTFSLREQDLFALERLKKTGLTRFNTTQFELDTAFSGTYNRRIAFVDVKVVALVGQSGIRGRLTKNSHSFIKQKDPFPNSGDTTLVSDWISLTPSSYRLKVVATPEETMLLSPFTVEQARSSLNRTSEETKGLFEGHGLSGIWELELPKYANEFNYDTIIDVILTINFVAYFDHQLKGAIELERRKLQALNAMPMGLNAGFSLKLNYPDAYYHFHNIANGTKHLLIPFRVEKSTFPPNQINRQLKETWLTFYSKEGPIPVKAKITCRSMNSDKLFDEIIETDNRDILNQLNWFGDFDEVTDPDTNLGLAVYRTDKLFNHGAQIEDFWVIRIDAEDNPRLLNDTQTFDHDSVEKIDDVALQLAYHYTVPGINGVPITMWAHFENDDTTPRYDVAVGNNHLIKEWRRPQGWKDTFSVDKINGTFRHTGTRSTDAYADKILPPSHEFELSLNALVEGTKSSAIIGVKSIDGKNQHFISLKKLRDPTDTGQTHKVRVAHRTKGKWAILSETAERLPDKKMSNIKIVSKVNDSNVRGEIQYFLNGKALLPVNTKTPSFKVNSIHLNANGDVQFDDLLVSDLTNRKDVH